MSDAASKRWSQMPSPWTKEMSMVANPNAHWDQVRWEIAPLPNRLPEHWTTWKSNNLSRMAAIKRLSHVLDPHRFFPLRGLLILTSWSPMQVGEQFILAIPTT